jgi:hypothetical protein
LVGVPDSAVFVVFRFETFDAIRCDAQRGNTNTLVEFRTRTHAQRGTALA